MDNESCLNCKYEPDWSEPTKGSHPYRSGKCKWNEVVVPPLPRCTYLCRTSIMRFSDDSGVFTNCPAWEAK
jgi:hypothetical protein